MLNLLEIRCSEIVQGIRFTRNARIFVAEASREFICYVFYVSVVHTIEQG